MTDIPAFTPATDPVPARHHWVATITGILDSAFNLTDTEQYEVSRIVNKLFETLNIPDRGEPSAIPMQVVQEMYAGVYSEQLGAANRVRPVRRATTNDCVAPLEAWRNALETMVTTAYPDLDSVDRVLLVKIVDDLLKAIGVPARAAVFLPDSVIAAVRDLEDAVTIRAE